MQLSRRVAEPPSGHLSDQGSLAVPTPGDPHHKDSIGKAYRPSFLPGETPRGDQLSSSVGATGDFFYYTVTLPARAFTAALTQTIASTCGFTSASYVCARLRSCACGAQAFASTACRAQPPASASARTIDPGRRPSLLQRAGHSLQPLTFRVGLRFLYCRRAFALANILASAP